MKIINGMKMYDTKEVCALLGIGNGTLIRYRREGLIRSIQIGRGKYTSEDCIRDFLNAKTQPGASDK